MNCETLPVALVLSWSASRLRVKCPFCHSSHGHSVKLRGPSRARRIETRLVRRADCDSVTGDHLYRILYPFEGYEIVSPFGWELDREEGEIYTVTNEGRLSDPLSLGAQGRRLLDKYQKSRSKDELDEATGDETGIVDSLNDIKLSDSAEADNSSTPIDNSWSASLTDASFRRKLYISACVLKDVQDLERLFSQYPEDQFAEVLDNEGCNGILLAVADEDGLETLKYLQQKGVSLDEANHYGRTALMEAALWGRLETVQYLLHHGASILAKDANGHCASDLATDSERNEEERICRAGGVVMVRPDANRKRRQIAEHLKRQETKGQSTSRRVKQPQIQPGVFSKLSEDKLNFYTYDVSFLIAPKGSPKAFARLDRGLQYPVISAMSGYSQEYRTDALNNAIWTKKAEELGRAIGHNVSASFASHVEKQLLAYYMDRHLIWEDSTLKSELDPPYQSLRGLLPTLPPAVITVSRSEMCEDCSNFEMQLRRQVPDLPVRIVCAGQTIKGLEEQAL